MHSEQTIKKLQKLFKDKWEKLVV